MGIIFEKVMTKTDLSYKTAGDLRSAGDPSAAIDDFKNYMGDVWLGFWGCFGGVLPVFRGVLRFWAGGVLLRLCFLQLNLP